MFLVVYNMRTSKCHDYLEVHAYLLVMRSKELMFEKINISRSFNINLLEQPFSYGMISLVENIHGDGSALISCWVKFHQCDGNAAIALW